MKEKFLPVGTVVTLKDATKKIMIIGYCPIDEKNNMYDYSACPIPTGIITPKNIFAFNHNQIKEINSLGTEDEEFTKFNNSLKEYIKGIENMKSINLPNNE